MRDDQHIEELFGELLLQSSPKDRAQFLEQCGDRDPDIRAHLEKLLAAHNEAGSFLGGEDVSTLTVDPKRLTGRTIGSYKLREVIGEGGMGVVYVAEQELPIRRQVALKVIKPGLDLDAVVARFEAERQALALMDHPNIAKVIEAGSTETGQPYFVMELVKGLPVTEYCDQNKLSTDARIALFIQVCNAVQHAHQKGIIHRDLKPSNVLVAQYDDKPVPKVIDFGVAKATQQKLTERTLYTQLGQIVGTLEYMSPEQAVMNQLDVDTRADVYSLGVILYELLIGETPLDAKELREKGLEQMLRSIRESEPLRPSIRLSSLGKAANQTAAYRQTDESTLSNVLRGELDWVVMKALEKDRRRRYDSASRLADDLNSYLSGEEVSARPPSLFYRVSKAWKRQRTAIVVTAVVLLSLLTVSANLWSSNIRLRSLIESRNEALQKWRHVLLEQGIEAALRGDVERTQELAASAIQAEADEVWIKLTLGVAKMISGETDEAVEILAEAHVESPGNLSIASALVMCAIGNRGAFHKRNQELNPNETSASTLMAELRNLKPSQEFGNIDKLFRAWTQLYENPSDSIETLGEIVDDKRPWVVSQAFFAMALVHEAADKGDPNVAMEALRAINRCEEQLGNSPFAMFVALDCRTVALLFASDLMTSAERSRVFDEAQQLADELGAFPSGWAVDFRAGFYELTNSEKTEAVYKRARNDWWCANRAAVMLRKDQDWLVEQVTPSSIGTPLQAVGDASALALLGRRDEAKEMYQQLAELEIWPVRLGTLELLLLLDEADECRARSASLLKEVEGAKDFFDPPFWHFERRLRFLAGEAGFGPEQFLASVEGSLFAECNANYLIGLSLRCRGESEKAEGYFQACVNTKQFWMWPYQFSKSILQLEYNVDLPVQLELE